MDKAVKEQLDDIVRRLKEEGLSAEEPVVKLMVAALAHQTQKIRDDIDSLPERVIDRLCSCFIPRNKVGPVPSLCLVQPAVRRRKEGTATELADGTSFIYKTDSRQMLSYFPLLRSRILPCSGLHLLGPGWMRSADGLTETVAGRKGQVWLGMQLASETDTLENAAFFIKGTEGVFPERILAANGDAPLSFAFADRLEEMAVMEPFDSQQTSTASMEVARCWQRTMASMEEGRLICITDPLQDRDVFKCKAYPKAFQQLLESRDLDRLQGNTLWLLFDFGEGYDVPDSIEIIPNVVPVVNVGLNSVTLTQTSPIARLSKNDGSCFLDVVETSLSSQRQGFGMLGDEVVIRDFDASCYNSETLYRDARNLYNRFIDDYYAFVDYHGLKDGELVRSLREVVNRIGKGVTDDREARNRYVDGVYAMRNVGNANRSASVKVSYLTTFGRQGNAPQSGSVMENRKDASLEKEVRVIAGGRGGEDKADADQRYDLLRYYTLTSDRLFTKMDVDAFIRVWLMKEFGQEEVKRISYGISVQGAGGADMLRRGLYIDLRFKDAKNYDRACSLGLDRKLRRLIEDKSCIPMPIIVLLVNLEENR